MRVQQLKKYEASIVAALQELSLTDDQIQAVIPELCKLAEFIDVQKNSSWYGFKDKVEHSADLLAIEKAQFIGAALKQPSLFFQRPETINSNIERSAELLAIEKAQFIGAALKQPQLFCQRPETINSNIERSAELLAIEKAQFIGAALKQPQLFCQRPETTNSNIERSAELLAIEKAQFIGAALKQPPLFYRKPETINSNIERSAELLAIEKAQFIGAALKQPPLFNQKPETVSRHAELMQEFNQRGIIVPSVQQAYLARPILLTLSDDNFKLRLTFAEHADIKEQEDYNLLRENRKTIERAMVQLLGHNPDQKIISSTYLKQNSYQILSEMVLDKRLKGYALEFDI